MSDYFMRKRAEDIKKLKKDNERLQKWVKKYQPHFFAKCSLCGHPYWPVNDVPDNPTELLKDHIENCPEHPMSALKRKNEQIMEWCYRALVALARRNFKNTSNGKKKWCDLLETIKNIFMHKARKEAGISHDDYLNEIRTNIYPLTEWSEKIEKEMQKNENNNEKETKEVS